MQHVIVNPLDLDIEWRAYVQPLHEVTDDDKLAALAVAIRSGWNGAPVVASRELAAAGQDRAYTGSHRIAAVALISEEDGTENTVPCIYIEDLCEAHGIDWDEIVERLGDDYEAAAEVAGLLPETIRSAYGLDTGGRF
jgi:hypothetical protein